MIFGTISPSGYEAGLFGALEQVMVPTLVPTEKLTRTFSNYNLYGFAGAAIGALIGSSFINASVKGDRTFFFVYAGLSLLLFSLYCCIDLVARQSGINFEKHEQQEVLSLEKARPAYNRTKEERDWTNIGWLAGLQGLDSFGGGFIAQTFISLWFVSRFNASPQFIGWMLCLTNIFASVSFLLAPTLAKRFGLLRTMVFTHFPCSLALAIIPFMPSAQAAAAILVVRSLFSSMDIPTRQAFAMVLVRPEMRTQAATITTAARAVAQAVSPMVCGASVLNAGGFFFLIGGLIKSAYDGLVFLRFRNTPLHMPEQSSSPLPKVAPVTSTRQTEVPNRELAAVK
jgi:predicted MFS family arabinose efflux permease